ncbi:MAG: Autolysin sensor kinase [Acidobacteria bacterium]|nr:Autolysin sensor kinase [Acidobacteriota bacterium]
MNEGAAGARRVTAFLLSWDRLGFRLLVFGLIALMWTLQLRLAGVPWQEAVRSEFGGAIPWAFFAPWVVALNRRIRRGRPAPWQFVAAHAGGMLLVYPPYWLVLRGLSFLWRWGASGWASPPFSAFAPTVQNVVGGFLSVPFVYFLILLGSEAMTHARARQEEAAQADRLARQLSDARLALLQRQLHPHFLFNALQAISTLLHRDPATADRLLVRLSELLRAMLDDASSGTMPLRTELELTRKYLEIEQARFGSRLSIDWRVDDSVLDVPVPSLVVLPLVENAVRHGLSRKVGPGRLAIEARREGESLLMTVEDDGLGASLPLPGGLGVGNTRQRLDAFYGSRAALDIDTEPQRGFRVTVRIPLVQERP